MNVSTLSFIGSNVRRFRKNRKWTQEDMAKRSNISRIALIHIESGKAVPTLDTLSSLASALEIPMTSLFAKPADKASELGTVHSDAREEVEAIDYELKSIFDKLRACNLNQVVTLRKVIDTVLLGYTDKESEAAPLPQTSSV
jgi:transcriptional regulator with XRE-family HTH domain